MRRAVLVLFGGALVACGRRAERVVDRSVEPTPSPSIVAAAAASADPAEAEPDPKAGEPARKPRARPSGAPPRLSCAAARALIADVEARLAAPIPPNRGAGPDLQRALADGTIDWADPHGLWTAAPDAPIAALVRARAGKLRAALEGKGDCAEGLRPIGEALSRWVADLRAEWDAAAAPSGAGDELVTTESAAAEGIFEDGAVTRAGKRLARELSIRAAAATKGRPELAPLLARAKDRWLPILEADAWTEVVLAAAVRAWVPLIDPHGAWAPSEEASILYDRDLELSPPPRLWTASTRTAVGVRIDAGAVAPLAERDVVVEIDGVVVAGLSGEAIDQLAETPDAEAAAPRVVSVLRAHEGSALRLLRLEIATAPVDDPLAPDPLPTERVPYADGEALVVKLGDVPDALGDDLARTIALARGGADGDSTLRGVVLDLRGNGGGSIDGASSALGLFLPGAPLFPLRHRDGAIETERASEPPVEDRWAGPLAAIVDGGTASAAEMIAGALHAYRRGVVVGTTTYGKGCAQEYVDDVTGLGVLRVTTLLFALPDGSAVQRVGLRPDLALALPAPPGVRDRETDLPRAAPPWAGPDVRDPKRVGEVPWPPSKHVGPCRDEIVCRALRSLATARLNVAKRH
jgi:carboxyl-terminal processing protease